MQADLKYVKYLEKEIDELKSDKAEFSNMYDMILQERVSNKVMCSYLLSLSDLDALAELQCLYLHKVKECDCLAQKLSKQTESVSNEVHAELLQRFAKVEKQSISLEIALQKCKEHVKKDTVWNEQAANVFRKEHEQYIEIQDLKAQLQDKNIAISELKKLNVKGKGKSMETKFDKPFVVQQPNAQRITKPSVLVDSNHFACVTKILNDVDARTKKPNLVPISTRKPKGHANKSVATPHKKKVASKSTTQKPKSYYRMLYKKTSKAWKDGEHLDKMKEKKDLYILVRYSTQSKGYRVYNKRTRLKVESIYIRFDEIKEMSETSVANDTSGLVPRRQKASDYDNSDPVPQLRNISSSADAHVPSQQELDLLFGPLYDEFFNAGSNLQDTQPTTNIQPTSSPSTPTYVHAEENNNNQAEEHLPDDEFTNPFCALVQEVAESSSHNIRNSNVPTFNQPQVSEYRWTKDHPLEQV
nr:hypothetical protein [Tanacetum cinerariifolium]